MSDFINKFTKNNYETSNKDEENNKDEILSDKKIEQKDLENESAALEKSKSNKGAFQKEIVTIDNTYHIQKTKQLLIVAASILSLIIFVTAIFFATNFKVAHDFVNEPVASAETWAKKEKVNYDITREYNNELEKDIVISQTISSGSKIWGKKLLTFVVSDGANPEELVKMDDFTTQNIADIEIFIKSNALINASIKKEIDSKVPINQLIRIEFPEGIDATNYRRKDKVTFFVSQGGQDSAKSVKMKDFIKRNISEAQAWAKENNIMLSEKEINSTIPAGYVVTQSVEKDQMIKQFDQIELTVSKGPGKPAPNFSGLNETEAINLAAKEKIQIQSSYLYSNNKKNAFISQSVAPGESYYETDLIIVVYSLGKPFIENYTSMEVNMAIDAISEKNKSGANLKYVISYVEANDETKNRGEILSINFSGEYIDVSSTIFINVAN